MFVIERLIICLAKYLVLLQIFAQNGENLQ